MVGFQMADEDDGWNHRPRMVGFQMADEDDGWSHKPRRVGFQAPLEEEEEEEQKHWPCAVDCLLMGLSIEVRHK